MSEEVQPWLPSLEVARAAKAHVPVKLYFGGAVNLLDRDPIETARLAAIVLVVSRGESPEAPFFRYPYVPSMPFTLEEGMVRALERHGSEPPPECLRVSVARRDRGDPYRGAPAGDPTFHGFDYGDALSQVRQRVAGMLAEHRGAPLEIRTYAWPILRLTFRTLLRRQEIALLVRRDGVMHATLARGSIFGSAR